MTEKTISPSESSEKPKNMWIKFREPIPNQHSRQEFGLVSWTPNFIPNGSRLEIDVYAANQLLRKMNIAFPIEIKPYRPPKDDQVMAVSSFSAKGEATASAMASKVKKPIGSNFFYDYSAGKGELLVNFSGLADYVETNITGGAKNPFFYQKLGKLVNLAVREQAGKIILYNYASKGLKEPSVFGMELIKMALCSFPFISMGILGSLASIAEGDPTEIQTLLVAGALMSELGWVAMDGMILGNFLLKQNRTLLDNPTEKYIGPEYAKYLIQKIEEGRSLDIVYPYNVTNNVIIPALNNALWRKPLIRGVKS